MCPLNVVISQAENEGLILPLMSAAKHRFQRDDYHKAPSFVTSEGMTLRKSEFIFGLVKKGRPRDSKLTANVMRHASVSLFARQKRTGMTPKEHANLLLHSEQMALKTYEILTDEDAVALTQKYRQSMYQML